MALLLGCVQEVLQPSINQAAIRLLKRHGVEVFQPLDPPLAALTAKLKAAFDPAGILNPGRMYPGV